MPGGRNPARRSATRCLEAERILVVRTASVVPGGVDSENSTSQAMAASLAVAERASLEGRGGPAQFVVGDAAR